MFTATITTLAAVAALNAQAVTASTPSAANAVSAPAATVVSAPALTAPGVNAVSVRSNSTTPRGVRIPGTFAVVADQNPLEGLEALYAVRSGDGG
ncbi:MAG: hypothetical protein QOJ39_2503 [Candidatus Eremiobacteraeota bacterium]|nr:hypothetical protein [Candidatus Eremiobacteraeota bacterium]